MSVHTRTPRTKETGKAKAKIKHPSKKIAHWRETFKSEIDKYSEAGLMLKGSRHKEGLTQAQLANALGMSQNHISEMENGKRPIGKEIALRFAKFFDTDYRKFL